MNHLYRLIYASRPTLPTSPGVIQALMESARRHNSLNGITGFLAYTPEAFVQALEGPAYALTACLGRLFQDPRHNHLQLMSYGPIDARTFPDWGMGCAALQQRHTLLLQRYSSAGRMTADAMTPAGALMLLEELSAEVMLKVPAGQLALSA